MNGLTAAITMASLLSTVVVGQPVDLEDANLEAALEGWPGVDDP